MKLSDLTRSGHWPTLLAAFLYFDFSFMVWTVLGPLGVQIGESLKLTPEEKGLMVAVPILSGAILRILLGLLVRKNHAKAATTSSLRARRPLNRRFRASSRAGFSNKG
jgi:NNP family nitrate/nitrite transporter-like MFS transporter